MIKRLLFSTALLALPTLEATAQDSDTHQVTIDVQEIAVLEIEGDVTLTFDAPNGLEAVNENASWPSEDEVFASDSDDTSYDIATNLAGAQIDLTAIGNDGIDGKNRKELELKVRSEERDGVLERDPAFKTLTELGKPTLDQGATLVDTVNPLDEENVTLEYHGVVTEDFAPDGGGPIEITYTITD